MDSFGSLLGLVEREWRQTERGDSRSKSRARSLALGHACDPPQRPAPLRLWVQTPPSKNRLKWPVLARVSWQGPLRWCRSREACPRGTKQPRVREAPLERRPNPLSASRAPNSPRPCKGQLRPADPAVIARAHSVRAGSKQSRARAAPLGRRGVPDHALHSRPEPWKTSRPEAARCHSHLSRPRPFATLWELGCEPIPVTPVGRPSQRPGPSND